jgi:hypothetical protein
MGQVLAKTAVAAATFTATYVVATYGVGKFDNWLKDRKAAKAA